MITSHRRNMSFENSNSLRDASSFSSYLNGSNTSTQESFVLKITSSNQNLNPLISNSSHHAYIGKKKAEDEEIGIFGAEKYFKGDGEIPIPILSPRLPNKENPRNQQEMYDQEMELKQKTRSGTPSIRSESSWNSRSALVPRHQPRRDPNKVPNVKALLSGFGCNCNDKNSVIINGSSKNTAHVKEPAKLATKPKPVSSSWADEDQGKNFSFPVLSLKTGRNYLDEENARKYSVEVFGSPVMEKAKKSFSLERKLTMLNWDGVTTPRMDPNYNDAASDASSDLFELESLSTSGTSFLTRQTSDRRTSSVNPTNCYAPSEASVEWSVVTAAAEISSDYEEIVSRKIADRVDRDSGRTRSEMERKGQGMLSSCKSHKAVSVAGNEYLVTREKALANARELHRVDTSMPITKFQAETKLMAGLVSRKGHHANFPTRSHQLYIQSLN